MRQPGRPPQACTSHWPGLKPVTPRRTIFWYFPRATQSGGQGKEKVCPSGPVVGVGGAAGAHATLKLKRNNKAMGSTPWTLHTLYHAMLVPPCTRCQLSDHQCCCHKPPTTMAAGIITYAPYPVNAALGRRAPGMRAFPVVSCGPSRDLSLLDSLLAR